VASEVKTLTDATFDDEVGKAPTPMIVDFWAPWCGPCRMVGPIIDEIAQEHGDKVCIGKLNVDENPGVASKFGIMSIPRSCCSRMVSQTRRSSGRARRPTSSASSS